MVLGRHSTPLVVDVLSVFFRETESVVCQSLSCSLSFSLPIYIYMPFFIYLYLICSMYQQLMTKYIDLAQVKEEERLEIVMTISFPIFIPRISP